MLERYCHNVEPIGCIPYMREQSRQLCKSSDWIIQQKIEGSCTSQSHEALYVNISRTPSLLPSQISEKQTKQAYRMLSDFLRYGMNTSVCRARTLVKYFGEELTDDRCHFLYVFPLILLSIHLYNFYHILTTCYFYFWHNWCKKILKMFKIMDVFI